MLIFSQYMKHSKMSEQFCRPLTKIKLEALAKNRKYLVYLQEVASYINCIEGIGL